MCGLLIYNAEVEARVYRQQRNILGSLAHTSESVHEYIHA